ncbi:MULTISPECIES: fumarylacetoacetate hydrolase family protein [Paraburkholderia]|uniref:Fumarylacetoacetate hydrolase family protein n=1 Tax=Paraburkholderia metrosideri TaxID=580937 RepID=A0ABW9E273_9BURK
MKLARFGAPGAEKPALVDADGMLRDLSSAIADINPAALSDASLAKIAAIDAKALPVVSGPVRLGPPVAQTGKIVCIGLNYTDHAKETGLSIPEEPVVFLKGCRPSGPNDDIRLPKDAQKADWEVELAIVIGKRALYVGKEDALSYVAGYCTFNDFTERSYQMERGGQWTKGKSFPGFAPIGPWLVTRDEVADPGSLHLWLDVNGKRHQDGNTKNFIFDVPTVISYLSQFIELEPGDIIATGTPAGVGLGHKPEPVFVKAGDVIELGIEGLGAQRQQILPWSS